MPFNQSDEKEVVVIGAGVVGLTTALRIQETGGYKVTIVAETLPTDPKSIRYTSQWAGAHHTSVAGEDQRQQRMDRETFKIMWDMSAPGGAAEHCFLRVTETDYYADESIVPKGLDHMPDFAYIKPDPSMEGMTTGVTFSTVTIDSGRYLNYLMARFMASGGTIVKGAIQHIQQIVVGGAEAFTAKRQGSMSPPAAVIVCAGLGARLLGGVEDTSVYPIRGQTVLLRAPWIRFGLGVCPGYGAESTYFIPRRCGDIIVGGCKVANDWYPRPRPEITRDILERALKVYPELVPPQKRRGGEGAEPTVEDAMELVIEEGCGLRPARKGGIRLEVEWFKGAGKSEVPVVYNYGHGGYGYQSSWGSATIALDLLEGALKKGSQAS